MCFLEFIRRELIHEEMPCEFLLKYESLRCRNGPTLDSSTVSLFSEAVSSRLLDVGRYDRLSHHEAGLAACL